MPDHLRSTYEMVECAFPEGLPKDAYRSLIAVLVQVMSNRALARFLEHYLDMEYADALYDVYEIGVDGLQPDEPNWVEEVEQKLKRCGFDDWLEE